MKAWEDFLTILEKEIGEAPVKKWLRTLKILKFDAQNLYLEAKDSFQHLWFEEHVKKRLDQFRNNNYRKIKVHLALSNQTTYTKNKILKQGAPAPRFSPILDEINPLFTLARYYITEDNAISHKILTEPFTFNPIYIYGAPGTGKTHLLMALTHEFGTKGLKATYARTETFTSHVVSAIRSSEMSLFRQMYRNIDCLLLDDVHELAHKGATQEELFHTFNTLHLAGKQIVLAGNSIPSQLQHIEPRLISRFEWGITLPINPYQKEDLKEILNYKCEDLNFPLNHKVRDFLIETFKSGTKNLVQSVEALVLRCHINKHVSTALTVPLVKHYLTDLILKEEEIKITPHKIIHAVAEQFGITADDILGASQAKESAFPRQIAMYLCRTQLKMPFKKIGYIFERDHSTVMTSVKLIETGQTNKGSGIDSLLPQVLKRMNH